MHIVTPAQSETAVTSPPQTKITINIRTLSQAILLFALFVALFAFVQFGTTALAGTDGYYHIKMGYLIRQEGLNPSFPWLPMTILNAADFYDHHLLYHVYLSLFASVDPAIDGGLALTQGAKIASIIMPALAFLAIWWLVRGQKVPWAAVWALALFAVSEAFLYRLSMPRAQSASLLVLALGLHWLLHGRYRLLIPLGFVYVWLYNAFPLLLVLVGVYVGATLLLERRFPWQAVAYPAVGIGLGLLINPYFPQNIVFILNHLLPKIGESATRVGNEWYPYETWTLVENAGFALAAFVLGALALGWRERRIDKATLAAFVLAVLFGVMLFQSRRFVEYYPAFALIFLALSVAPLWQTWQRKRPFLRRLLPLILLLLLAFPLKTTLTQARETMSKAKAADRYAAAALWLRANTPPETRIFQTDWDDFTRLFFYNTAAVYTVGLDPTYMELYDASLFDEWVDITKGRVDDPGAIIHERFGAEYAFSDLKHEGFIEEAAADPYLKEIYRDDDAVIFAVVMDEKE